MFDDVAACEREAKPLPRPPVWALFLAGLALLWVIVLGLRPSRSTSVSRLTPEVRAELLQLTYRAARIDCANEGLAAECQHQAALLLAFDECQGACRAFAKAHLPPLGR